MMAQEEFKIFIQQTCPHCKGTKGAMIFDDELEREEYHPCIWCEGKGTVKEWIGIEEFAEKLSVALYGNESVEDVHASETRPAGSNGSSTP
ncbi:MAG: hypothetical protein H3C35_03550 [Bacteroidetes bacterium]|nr:hypothetical protein [Bacteroidota bacterium]